MNSVCSCSKEALGAAGGQAGRTVVFDQRRVHGKSYKSTILAKLRQARAMKGQTLIVVACHPANCGMHRYERYVDCDALCRERRGEKDRGYGTKSW